MRGLTRRVRRLEDAAVDGGGDLVEAPPPRPEFVAALAELCGQAPEDVARSMAKHSRPGLVPRRAGGKLPEELRRQLSERCRMGPDGRPEEGW